MTSTASSPVKPVDLVVIGSGPGGYVAAIRAAQLGMSVVLVEKDPKPGGCCLHRGCIPTKALLHTAELLQHFKESARHGLRVDNVQLDILEVHNQKDAVVQKLARGIEGLLKKNRILFKTGVGKIAGPGTVAVQEANGKSEPIAARNILIATGSVPASLPAAPFDGRNILSSDHILELKKVPASIAIIGAGAVGVEFASIYSSFGSKVHLIELLPQILPLEDPDIAQALTRSFRARGIEVLTQARLESARVDDKSGSVRSRVQKSAGGAEEIQTEILLVAAGRKPVTEGLGLEAAGIRLEKGFIPVNSWCETAKPGIYAIGDVIDTPQLAHVASAEGILAVERMAGRDRQPLDYRLTPSCTYCYPEVASVGWTEPVARKQGHDVRVGKFPFAALGKASILGETEGFVKIVADGKYDEILGVHMIGPRATDLIAEACAAMQLEATVEELSRTIHPHPTLSESLMEAAHAVYGHGIHS
ncbi:MAG: dihydrolipoyl dehydrogenase [Planctomycetes bacterium]|nr:dihydrolipoyl dehydrogenase [Planctomycetota bacterium]